MKKKKIPSRRAAIPVRAIDFVMYNTKNNQSALRIEETTVWGPL